MIFKVLLLGALAALCFADVPKELKADVEDEIAQEIKLVPIPYNFEYNTEDVNGTSQFRKESGDGNGKVSGRYGYTDAFGVERIVEYVADENGYRAQIRTNEPGTDNVSPAAVQFNAQPLVYQLPARDTQTYQPTESSEESMKRQQGNQPAESSFPDAVQDQQFSSLSSTSSPSTQQYSFYGENAPNSIIHHIDGQPPVAIPAQEAPSRYQPISRNFYSAEQTSGIQKPSEQQYANQRSQEQLMSQMPSLQTPQVLQYASQKSQEQQYANQAPQIQQYANQKSQDQLNANQVPQIQQYASPKSQDQQYANQIPLAQQYSTQKSQVQQYANQMPQVQQYASQESQDQLNANQIPHIQQYATQKSQDQQRNQKSHQLNAIHQAPQQYNNQELSYNSLNAQYDSLRSQGHLVRLYTPNVQFIAPSIPQQEAAAKQLYHQPAPQNLVHSAAVQKHTYSLLPVPQTYSQDNTSPLVHQYITLQRQPVVRPVTLTNTNQYSFYPATTQAYASQEKQVSTLSTQSS